MVMNARFFFTIMLFCFICVIFPDLNNAVLNANITDTGVKSIVDRMPLILLVVAGILPIYTGLMGRKK